jgi:hypothetical protein
LYITVAFTISDSDFIMSSVWPFIPFKFSIFSFFRPKPDQARFDQKHIDHPNCIDSGLWDQLRDSGTNISEYLNSEIINIIGSSIFEFVNTAYDKKGELKYPSFVKDTLNKILYYLIEVNIKMKQII